MKCAVMQPTYFPWIGYFDLIDSVDKFVFLNDVKLVKGSWHARNRIKTAQGQVYLTIPIQRTSGAEQTKINEALVSSTAPWREKHLKTIEQSYSKSKYKNDVIPFIRKLLDIKTNYLADVTINIIREITNRLGIETQFHLSSDLEGISGTKDVLVANIVKAISCDEYVSPYSAGEYIERGAPGGAFASSNIRLSYQNYVHPTYQQMHGPFCSHMAILDLLFNEGFTRALSIIRQGHRLEFDYMQYRENHQLSCATE